MVVDYEYTCAAGHTFTGKTFGCFLYEDGDCSEHPVTGGGGTWEMGGGGPGTWQGSDGPVAGGISGVKCFPPPFSNGSCEGGGCGGGTCRAADHDNLQDRCTPTGSYVQTAMRQYQRDDVDLSVKVPGGVIEVKRWYYANRWRFDHERNSLRFIYAIPDLTGSGGAVIESISKGGVIYDPTSVGGNVFINDIYRIVKTDSGWRWEDKSGGFKIYDVYGRILSEGSRNGVVAKYVYEAGPDGKLIGITDRSDTPVITFENPRGYPSGNRQRGPPGGIRIRRVPADRGNRRSGTCYHLRVYRARRRRLG